MSDFRIHTGDSLDVLSTMPDESIDCCVTSPPYFGLRDYGNIAQIGLESTPDAYVAKLVQVFREVKRVLRNNGTMWLNIGDSYCAPNGRSGGHLYESKGPNSQLSHMAKVQACVGAGRTFGDSKPKDLLGIPWRVAFALQSDGWYLRQDIIWHKPNPMPESVRDRCTKAHEYIFLLSKSERYYYDQEAIAEPLADASIARLSQNVDAQAGSDRVPGKTNGAMKAVGNTDGTRNRRSVWSVTTAPFKEAHFATFPPDLIRPCILAGCPEGGTVLDPFNGAGTTGVVCMEESREYVGIELNPEYVAMSERRIMASQPQWFGAAL